MLPLVIAAAVPATSSFAQSVVCHPIRRGESAADVARRVTGDSRNMYSPSFQIRNAASRAVPKSQYEGIRAGWRACVAQPPTRSAASVARRARRSKAPDAIDVAPEPVAPESVASEPVAPVLVRLDEPSAAPDLPRPRRADFTMLWLGAAIAAPWTWLQMLHVYRSRASRSILIQQFVDRFVDEFERPLIQHDGAERPLRSRVRRARRGRFDILLAPGQGRRYPNLTDHRRNVEYDITRVMRALGDDAFVAGALSTQAEWVVVPFQSRTASRQPKIT